MQLMKTSKTENRILEKLRLDGALHMSVIDPEKFSADQMMQVAANLESSGTDIIAVGGTTGIIDLDKKAKAAKKTTKLPLIIFPSNLWSCTKYADAVFFISLINSRQVYYQFGVQVLASTVVKKLGIDVIPVSYMLFEPGKKAGWISDANLLPRDDAELATACALCGEYQGAHFVFMEAGSGAEDPIPPTIIESVKKSISLPLIVGSGIKTAEQAAAAVRAGADIVDTGNIIANGNEIAEICKAIKEEGKKRRRQKT
jgi:phosphoglycerol geranylgeranyltransferase